MGREASLLSRGGPAIVVDDIDAKARADVARVEKAGGQAWRWPATGRSRRRAADGYEGVRRSARCRALHNAGVREYRASSVLET